MIHRLLGILFSTIVGVATAIADQAPEGGPPPPLPPLRIGALFHLTGEFAVQGQAFRQGVEIAAEEINRNGGVLGHPLEILFEDTQYKPLQATIGAKKLLQNSSLIGTLISTVTEAKAAALPLRQQKVPVIVLWDSSPEVEALGEYVFGIGPWAPASGELSADFVARHPAWMRNIAIVNSNTEWSLFVSTYFEDRIKQRGGRIIGTFSFNPDESDFRSVLLKLRSEKVTAIYAPIDGNIAPFFKQAKQLLPEIPLVTSDIVTEDLLTADPGTFEGVYQSMTVNSQTAAAHHLDGLYQKRFGIAPQQRSFVAWAYDGVHLLASAATAQQTTSATAVRDGLRKISGHQGASGMITITPRGSAPRPVQIHQVHQGAFVPRDSEPLR